MIRPFLVAVLASTAAAQGVVSPAQFAVAEGLSVASNGLTTSSSPSVLLMVLDELQGTPRTIKGVSFRRDGGTTSAAGAVTLLLNAFASTAATTAGAPSATLAANHGANKAQLSSSLLVQLPATTFSGPVEPFDYRIPFTQPFAFDGAGPLCVELQVTTRTGSAVSLDYTRANTNPQPFLQSFGSGCKVTGSTRNCSLSFSATTTWSSSTAKFSYTGSNFLPSSLLSLLLGFSRASIGGVPLPFELPGSRTAGSGPCTLYNDITITVLALTDGSGNLATLNLSNIPINLSMNGGTVYAQAIQLDPSANPWGMVLSNGTLAQVIAPYSPSTVGTVYSNTTLGPTGTARAGEGYVVRLDT